MFVSEPAGLRDYRKPVLTEPSLDNRQLNWFNQSNLRRSGHELRLWRSAGSNLVADQLPAGWRFCEDDAALEFAAGGFTAVLTFQRHMIDRDRYIAVSKCGRTYLNESARGSQKSPVSPMLSKMPRISAAAGRRDTSSSRVLYQVTARCQS